MHADRVLPGLAAARTVHVGAECTLRVHRRPPIDISWTLTSTGEPLGPLRSIPQAPTAATTVPWGRTDGRRTNINEEVTKCTHDDDSSLAQRC